ncbi:hypothetical protein NDU88_007661 [Pleurodeles waltl]|uniref:Uncharacterized protein n=1 Tax=Pleurodeles waltl TaxID=8319 RepID=A0AAV7PUK5_PLEWA|nr:hypothetical protein NDU88_007661 [Pleurodeles waltl]
MTDSVTREGKRSRTDELLEALMLQMDAMDQAIASLRAQPAGSDLGDIRCEHERLGWHMPMEVKEEIWKGVDIDIFDLLVDRPERNEVKHCKECAHSRECGQGPHKRKVKESLNNWVRAFSIYQSIIAERVNDHESQLAFYQNRIVSAHDEYRGTAWKDYDMEFRRIKANKPSLGGTKLI